MGEQIAQAILAYINDRVIAGWVSSLVAAIIFLFDAYLVISKTITGTEAIIMLLIAIFCLSMSGKKKEDGTNNPSTI